MNAAAPDTFPPSSEHRAVARRKRLFQLQRIVWELMFERYRKVILRDYDDSEGADLIEALRACSLYVEQIESTGWVEPLVFRINGIDGNEYTIGFELMEPGFRLAAARVESSSLTLPAAESVWEDDTHTTLRGKPGFAEVSTLGNVTVDRAFLVGMSMVIGLMDQQGDEDDRLMPLFKKITPTTEELEIMSDPAVMMGKPVIRGTRITVELILEKLGAGESVEQLIEAHPRLTHEAVREALSFAARALRADVSYPIAIQST